MINLLKNALFTAAFLKVFASIPSLTVTYFLILFVWGFLSVFVYNYLENVDDYFQDIYGVRPSTNNIMNFTFIVFSPIFVFVTYLENKKIFYETLAEFLGLKNIEFRSPFKSLEFQNPILITKKEEKPDV